MRGRAPLTPRFMVRDSRQVRWIVKQVLSTPLLEPKLILWFGNRNDVRDYDILVIDESLQETRAFQIGKADVVIVHIQTIEHVLSLRDVFFTDALFTGEKAWGDNAVQKHLLDISHKSSYNTKVRQYLIVSGMNYYSEAVRLLNQFQGREMEKSEGVEVIVRLSFSASYFAAAQFYYGNPLSPPVPLSQILNARFIISSIAQEARTLVRNINRNVEALSFKTIEMLSLKIEEWLLSLRKQSDR